MKPKLYRKRYIPNEIVELKNDEILILNEKRMITKWDVLKPRTDFKHGISCYFLEEGFKISRFMNENNELVYYYCDIIKTEFDKEKNEYIFHDLLVDVIVYPDQFVKVVDLAEVSEALDKKLISVEEAKETLEKTDKLLSIIYANDFHSLTQHVNTYSEKELECRFYE